MIRKLLATTAFATVLATGAFAQEATTTAPATTDPATTAPAGADTTTNGGAAQGSTMQGGMAQMADGYLASNLIGETVYNGTADNAEQIGEVNDLVVGNSGQVESVIVGVGGFLGIGEKNVAMNFSEIQWADNNGDRYIVVNATKEQLEGLPTFDRTPYDPVAAAGAAANNAATAAGTAAATTAAGAATAANNMAADAGNAANNAAADVNNAANNVATDVNQAANNAATGTGTTNTTDATQTGAIDRTQLTEVPAADLTAETLVGTTVYGANDANIGEIGDIVLTQDGKVDAVLIDVGGFLGIGEKRVAVGMDKLSFLQDANGNRYLYTSFSQEQLEAQAAYDEGTYGQNRDQQRLIVQ